MDKFAKWRKQVSEAAEDLADQVSEAASDLGDKVSEYADKAQDAVAHAVDKYLYILDQFKTGAVVVLVSRTSGQALQLVKADGEKFGSFKGKMYKWGVMDCSVLRLDGRGFTGEDPDSSRWTVEDLGDYIVQLHCHDAYLAIVAGGLRIMRYTDPAKAGPETKFQLKHDEEFVILEALAQPDHHVGILGDGALKPASETGTEEDAHFVVKLISTPFPAEEDKEKKEDGEAENE